MLIDIYQRCNFAGIEQENYEEAIKHDVWKKAVEEEIQMIEKKLLESLWLFLDKEKL